MVGYEGLLTWTFKKFGVPLDSLQFPMSPNNKIGVKCLNNLHLRVSEKGIMEEIINEDVKEVNSEEEKEDEEKEKELNEGKEKEDEKEKKKRISSLF